jgi:LuxR family maltose regulon positive regulatory protein
MPQQRQARALRHAAMGDRPDDFVPLPSKLCAPGLPQYCVERPEALAALQQAVKYSLTVVAAPAGSGKTTLLSQWYGKQEPSSPIAWLSLDQYDNDPARLFAHLRAALKTHGISLPAQHSDVATFMTSLADATPPPGTRKLVLILDNTDALRDSKALEQLRFVMEHSPACIRWVISGRGTPNLNAGTFALRDQLLRIESQLDGDAHFVIALGSKLGHGISASDAERICLATEGWIAGIKLALVKQPNQEQDSTHAYFAGVFTSQPLLLRQFLLASSVVGTINGDLANALLASQRGQSLLATCVNTQLFLRRTDSGDYRFTSLFLNYLRVISRREIPDQLNELHLRASRWYAERQEYEPALQHAFQCTDGAWRLDLLALATRYYVKQGAIEKALRCSEALSTVELYAREALWTTRATALILARRFANASALLQHATELHAANALSGHGIAAKLQTLQLMLKLLSTRISDDAAACPLDSADTYLTGTLLSLQAYWLLNQQRFDAAGRRALQARDLLLAQGSQYGATHANAILCSALGHVAQYDAALNHCERVFALLQTGPRSTAWANAATALAHVRYEQNRIAEAQSLSLEALPKLASVSSVQAFAATAIVLARTYAANADFPNAWRTLDDLHGYLETGCSKYLLAQICFEKIRLCLLCERPGDAEAVAIEFSLDALESQQAWDAGGSGEIFIDAALARLGCAQALRLLKAGKHCRCQTILQTLIADTKSTGYTHRRIALLALQSVCLNDMGQPNAASKTLAQALALTPTHGFMRSVFDEVPRLNQLLLMTDAGLPALAVKHVEKFPELFAIAVQDNPHVARSRKRRAAILQQEPLTDRETTVLRLLSQGLSNQEICTRSNIALTTTKWHLKNIFAKLHVGTRTAALARARALHLID